MFDEYNDDDDDGYFYGGFGGKNDGLKVVLVAPDRSPAAPAPAAATGQCCGKKKSAAAEGSDAVAATGADNTAQNFPAPVLATGWAGAGVGKYWNTRGDPREGERGETAPAAAALRRGRARGGEGERGSGTEVGEAIIASGRTD